MADVSACDVSNNGEVFEDVEVDPDPSNILNNVEQACTKILIPSMAQSSMSKLSSGDPDEASDVMFPVMKTSEVDDDSNSSNVTKYVVPSEDTKYVVSQHEENKDLKRIPSVSSPIQRTVKWSLETMAEAMDMVLGGELTTTQAAKKFGIPRTTLLDRLAMKVKSQYLESPGSFPLSQENDAKIVEFVLANPNLKKSTLIKGMMALAEELASKQGRPFDSPLNTRKWLKLFVCKHPKLDILQYSRRRSVSHSPQLQSNGSTSLVRATNTIPSTGKPVVSTEGSVIRIQHIATTQGSLLQQVQNTQSLPNEIEIRLPDELVQGVPTQEEPFSPTDSFEINLAKQALDAIEQKLTPEQQSYFEYRYFNNALDRGYDLWKHCRDKSDAVDSENFETVLSSQALTGIEQALDEEHVKYFRFRYENAELEEGYKLWLMMKKKSTK